LINHPFIDGNKRTAFAAADVFLRLNGQRLRGEPARIFERLMLWISAAENRGALIKADLET
jgi:death-on-curing protein